MRARLMERFDDGTIKRRLEGVTLEDWKRKTSEVGVNRIAQGIDGAKDKVVAFAEQLLPAVEAAQNKVKAMPDLTLEDSINRMTTFVRDMSKFKKR
jgi:hypothetical protein